MEFINLAMIDHASEMAAFVRVVDSKGFSAAAAGLGLTPSAVSKLVTRLETRLGVRLLQRTTRALHLTEEGEVFYAAAQRIVGEIETLEDQITGQSGTPQGLLRVTTSLAFATHQLAPVLSEFLARHPLVQLDLLPTDRVIDMVEEGIDIAIRIGRLADTSFMARKIGEDKRLICAAPSYLARHGTPRRPEELARHNCIVSRERVYLNRWPFKIDGQVERDRGRRPGRHQRGRDADAAGAAGHRHRPPDAAHPGPRHPRRRAGAVARRLLGRRAGRHPRRLSPPPAPRRPRSRLSSIS